MRRNSHTSATKPMLGKGLAPRHAAFIAALVADPRWNITHAAKAAGYKGNLATLAVQGNHVLKNVKVREIIQAYFTSKHLTRDQVLARLGDMALGDVTLFFTKSGRFSWAKFHKYGHLVKSFTPPSKESPNGKIEVHSPHHALALISRMMGWEQPTKLELSGPGGGPLERRIEVVVVKEPRQLGNSNGDNENKAIEVEGAVIKP